MGPSTLRLDETKADGYGDEGPGKGLSFFSSLPGTKRDSSFASTPSSTNDNDKDDEDKDQASRRAISFSLRCQARVAESATTTIEMTEAPSPLPRTQAPTIETTMTETTDLVKAHYSFHS